jgi:HlyD family secretion protein
MFTKLFPWVKSHKLLISIIVLVALFLGWKYSQDPVSPYETTSASIGDLVQEVSVTGKVQSQESIDLAFEKGGRITVVSADVGSVVRRGDTLVRLDGADISASLSQAEANLAFEEATLAKLLRGSREEDIQVSEVTLANAKASLDDAKSSLSQNLFDGYTKTDDAIRNKTDIFFNNPRTNPEINVPILDSKLILELVELRKLVEKDLVAWKKDLDMLETDADPSTRLPDAKRYLTEVKFFLDKLATGINGLNPYSNLSQVSIDTYKADVSAARSAVNLAQSNLLSSEEKWRAGNASVALASQQLALKRAGATPEEISAQKAKIASARASIQSYQAQLTKMTLVAPLDGVVTKQDAKRGAIAGAGVTLVSLQSKGAYKIEANIPEVDIAKIAVADTAKITLDAYGDGVAFMGTVASIDPSERVIDGVPTYKVTLTFADTEEKVRSGMTANITIETDKKTGVLAVPARAVKEKDGQKVVRVLPAGDPTLVTPVERVVETGLRSSDGRVEIVSGLSEGETVITFEKTSA